MMQHSFNFDEQLKMSEGVCGTQSIEQILLEKFPDAVRAERANLSEDKSGVDYWVVTSSGKRYGIDLKAREKDFSKDNPNKDDLALEIWSVVNKKIGWTRDPEKKTDYILFLWKDTGRYSLVPFPLLYGVFSNHWQEWGKKYFAPFQHSYEKNSRWFSQCVFVPRLLVWREMHSSYGGAPAKPVRQVNLQANLSNGIERAKKANYHNPGGKPYE